ncbi:MAG: amylo-alpha-1,6-glucosidase, partial [Nitrospirota bacterium]
MTEILRIKDRFYISTASVLSGERTRVLKHGDSFAVFDRHGDMQAFAQGTHGVYVGGTRMLSSLRLSLGNDRPLLLSSTVREDNTLLAVDLTNPDIYVNRELIIPRGTLHLFRAIFMWSGCVYERVRIRNYGLAPVETSLAFQFSADFADIFEVRGMARERRGRRLQSRLEPGAVVMAYRGLDDVVRQTRLVFEPAPAELTASMARFMLRLEPQDEAVLYLTMSCPIDAEPARRVSYDRAFEEATTTLKDAVEKNCHVYTSNEQFNDWLNRSLADLHMMVTDTPNGPYPYAGVPWFNTAFGRDGIITAMELLWVNPELARGVLAYLAAMQARDSAPERDAEPGKILHETRQGEMADLGEVPFGRYYGSIDATPLFIMLAADYYRRTGDRPFLEELWGAIERALAWLDACGDLDGDGFVEYKRRSGKKGLIHQGWKDSHDAVFHADGALADGPIALCEVQAYVYAAKRGAAELAAILGRRELAAALSQQAWQLQERFERTFWIEERSTYALALDGDKRLCQARTSNAGHCLFAGIAHEDHARLLGQSLLAHDMFSGWGVRTVAASEARFNPMSYHNGSVWPHDNAMIAFGLARYGFKEAALRIVSGLFDASLFFDLHRMPELFCGFPRRPWEGPTHYPVACAPQSWAAGAVFMLLQAALGLSINGVTGEITFSYPALPEFLQRVQIQNLRVGKARVDLLIQRHVQDVAINVTRREGDVKVL